MLRLLLVAATFAMAGLSAQQEPAAATAKPQGEAQKPAYEQRAALYPIDTCIVSGEKLDDSAVTFTAGGTTFKTCCDKCQAKVVKDTATFQQKLEDANKQAQLAHYPLKTCAISGEELGGMGKPVQLVLDGTLVQLCCKNCVAKAKANAAAMVKKVDDAAYEAQRKAYPLDTCVVGGEKLGADSKDVMFGQTLVRTCCSKCADKFEKEPSKYLPKLHEAWMQKASHGDGKDEKKPEGGDAGKNGDKK